MSLFTRIKERARRRYRLMVIRSETFEERVNREFKLGSLWWLVGLSVFAIIAITTVVIFFTPVRELIPGYTDSQMREEYKQLRTNFQVLQQRFERQDSVLKSIQRIRTFDDEQLAQMEANGETPAAQPQPKPQPNPQTQPNTPANDGPPDVQDYQLRANADAQKKEFNISDGRRPSLPEITLLAPVKGDIISKFEPGKGHFAIDVATAEKAPIRAVDEGVVVFSDYTLRNGHSIGILHPSGLVSVYRHNSAILKKNGSFVGAGDVIAFAGNSGENTSGPHLHFELWWDSQPLDPLKLLTFAP